jgi:GNAT superfamily N-acetyltransferase
MYEIDLATLQDVPLLPAIEEAAGEMFSEYAFTADLPPYPTSLEEFYEAQKENCLWVARAEDGTPVGFALVELFGEEAHLEELDVSPDYGRRGIGTRLVRAVIEWARATGVGVITLSTFRDIPWNAPFYERLGFRALQPEELTGELRERVEDEERAGLPRQLRVPMRYVIADHS